MKVVFSLVVLSIGVWLGLSLWVSAPQPVATQPQHLTPADLAFLHNGNVPVPTEYGKHGRSKLPDFK